MKFKLPSWLRKDKLQLPPWASVKETADERLSIVIDVDTQAATKYWLEQLGAQEVTQYWLECAYQCAKLDVQAALVGTPYDPRTAGKSAEFHFSRAPEYAQRNHPMGHPLTEENRRKVRDSKGRFSAVDAATKGKEARSHYIRIRGRLPF